MADQEHQSVIREIMSLERAKSAHILKFTSVSIEDLQLFDQILEVNYGTTTHWCFFDKLTQSGMAAIFPKNKTDSKDINLCNRAKFK